MARCSSRVRASAPSWVMPRQHACPLVELGEAFDQRGHTELPDAAVMAALELARPPGHQLGHR